MRRLALVVSAEKAEEARALLLELVPEGFEEREQGGVVELAVYVEPAREAILRGAFPGVRAATVEPGWELNWRDFHRPARIGPLWVGPPWAEPDADTIAVVIDPGLAFGTGSHPTTRLCLEFLLELPVSSLLDLGCGSGVLAVAAAKLGFAPVRAVDLDPHAVAATRANAAANGVSIEVELADGLTAASDPADVAVANIALDAVQALGASIASTRVVTSGYLVHGAARLPGYRCVRRREHSEWAAELHERE